jgi:hypothetical protein
VFGNDNAIVWPTDPVTVTDQDGNTMRMRVVKRADNYPLMELDLVRDDASILTSQAIASADYTASISVAPLIDTEMVLLDIPMLRDLDDSPGFYVAAKGSDSPWPGCVIFRSNDDVAFSIVDTITESGVLGDCTTALGNWTGAHIFDETNKVRVDVGNSTLTSTTNDAIINDISENAFAIGAHGRWELGQFRDATLISSSPNVYELSGLLRGRRGTEWAAVNHLSTDKFVLLRMSGLRRVSLTNAQLGVGYYYRAITMNRKLSTATSTLFSCNGVSQEPFSPFNLLATVSALSGDVTITAQRRSRYSVRMIGVLGISVPADEASYEWDILAPGSPTVVLRTLTSTDITVQYTAAQLSSDYGSPAPSTIRVKIYPISTDVGRGQGFEATVTLQ